MLLDRYQQDNLFVNMNFLEVASNGLQAYRGDLVLVEGEVADASGRRRPPTATVRQSVILASEDKLQFVAGLLDDLGRLEAFESRYSVDLGPGVNLLFFVTNIAAPVQVKLASGVAMALPLDDGMVWNELLDELKLDKDDLKGKSSADKVATVLGAMVDYRAKGDVINLADVATRIVTVKREGRGAV